MPTLLELARCALAALLFHAPAGLQSSAEPASKDPAVPRARLVVVLAVDQMVPEQLERLAPLFTGGFKRIREQGRDFCEAALEYADTETGPGHATYGTGCNPLHHGIVGNDWVLPESKHAEYCVADPESLPVTDLGQQTGDEYQHYHLSPTNVRKGALIDHLRRGDPESKAVTISIKDRAAIAMGGQHPDLALWWDRVRGGYMSSTWYAQALPPWVIEFDAHWTDVLRKGEYARGWESSLPANLSGTATAPDDREGEVPWDGRRTFPYPAIKLSEVPKRGELSDAAAAVYASPVGDLLSLELARAAVEQMQLGADEHTDVLAISLSACDTVGHSFGPYSREVTDVILRADRELGLLFALLDERVGKDRWILSLSADHGVLELPETLVQQGIGAQRVPSKTVSASIKAMRAKLKERFGDDFYLTKDGRGVRFSWSRIRAAGKSPQEVRRAAADALLAEGREWLEAVWTLDELEACARKGATCDGLTRMAANSFDEERTPDITVLQKPWLLLGLPLGTTHGTPYPYDRRVPLYFLGIPFAPGSSSDRASSVDALPTLLTALGVAIPDGLDGRALDVR